MTDLRNNIEIWQTAGDHLIIMGDFNEPVNGPQFRQFFSQLNLKEGIQHHHPSLIPPNTFHGGSHPIDGIFISHGLIINKSGYSATDWGIFTDHRLLWIEIDTSNLFHPSDIPSWTPPKHVA
jgi:endonuclease/exonuclease/phosphatase family metal-dependent hydrolase